MIFEATAMVDMISISTWELSYRSEKQNTTYYVSCVCERHEWEFLQKTKRGGLPSDMQLLKHMWKRVSS